MAGEFTAVGLGSQPPDMMMKLSQLLSVRGQQQALQGQAAEVAGAQQTQHQRAALAKYDWNRHLGEDGTIDLNTLTDPELQKAAGDQYPELIQRMTQAKTAQTESRRTLTALRNDQREAFGSIMNGLRSDKDVSEDNEKGRQKVNEAMIQFGEMYGEDVLPVLQAYAKPLQGAPKGRLSDALRAVGLQAMSAGAQIGAQQPQYTSTGGQLTNVNPNAAGVPPSLPLTIGPGEQDVITTDQLGNQNRVLRTPRGDIAATAPLGGPDGGPARFGVGERHAFESQANANFEAVTANRTAASMAPQQLDQIDKALNLSKSVSTGAWAAKRGEIESGLGSLIPGYQGVDDASKLQLLDKFAERIATDASRVLGVNATTDAQRESIHKQNANIGYTPKAVQDVLQYAKAQTMAMEAKGNAQEIWLMQEGNGITKQHEFETKFRQAYDPRVFQFEVMSAPEQDEYLKTLKPDEKKSLKAKTRALIELGAIPGG